MTSSIVGADDLVDRRVSGIGRGRAAVTVVNDRPQLPFFGSPELLTVAPVNAKSGLAMVVVVLLSETAVVCNGVTRKVATPVGVSALDCQLKGEACRDTRRERKARGSGGVVHRKVGHSSLQEVGHCTRACIACCGNRFATVDDQRPGFVSSGLGDINRY